MVNMPLVQDRYISLDETMATHAETLSTYTSEDRRSSSPFSVALQVFPPFLVAGVGMVVAGQLLHKAHQWPVFVEVPQLLILVPALLGLKGNLEMTLAARISTHANLGELDDWREPAFSRIVFGNISVVQCQAIVVGFLAAVVAVVMDFVVSGNLSSWPNFLLLATSAVAAASVASFVLAGIMICLVVSARCARVDPDNVAAPIAGMLGDCVTLGLLSTIASSVWSTWSEPGMVLFLLAYLLVMPLFALFAMRISCTAAALKEGWTPTLAAMCISSVGGMMLKDGIQVSKQLAQFAPVMNGSGGNLAAIHTSRLSTDYFVSLTPRTPSTAPSTPSSNNDDCEAPVQCQVSIEQFEGLRGRWVFCGKGSQAAVGRVLSLLSAPGAVFFATLIVGLRSGWSELPTPLFVIVFASTSFVQSSMLIQVAHSLVGFTTYLGLNPDNVAIPYVTSLGDLIGCTSLTAAFLLLRHLQGSVWDGPGGEL